MLLSKTSKPAPVLRKCSKLKRMKFHICMSSKRARGGLFPVLSFLSYGRYSPPTIKTEVLCVHEAIVQCPRERWATHTVGVLISDKVQTVRQRSTKVRNVQMETSYEKAAEA